MQSMVLEPTPHVFWRVMIPLWRLKLPKIMEIKNLRRPGIEPGSIAWEATMLTFTPPTLLNTERSFKYSFLFVVFIKKSKSKILRQPGIEPGSIAWKATMLTFTPPTL